VKNVASKISSAMPFEETWRLAAEYVRRLDKSVLPSQEKFSERVYKPVRDSFPEGLERRRQATLF